jgi:esterase/lipase superfamily enzyme
MIEFSSQMLRSLPFLLILLLAACAPRANLNLIADNASIGVHHNVFVASTLTFSDESQSFIDDTRDALSFASYTVSVPPIHKPGEVELPKRATPDPAKHFLAVTGNRFGSSKDFVSQVQRTARKGGNEIIVYVHGFNNTLGDSVFRIAQITHDFDIDAAAISFGWSSAASPLGYLYDRGSALLARDELEKLLTTLAQKTNADILLVAHSMGTFLTMETLRQLSISGNQAVLDRLSGVILMSADIDIDVFKSQARRIPKLPQPFFLFTSANDRVLKLSARLTGQTDRLGNISNAEPVAEFEVTVVDVAAFTKDSATGHLVHASSPVLISILSQANAVNDSLQNDPNARSGFLPSATITVQNATQIILSPGSSTQ